MNGIILKLVLFYNTSDIYLAYEGGASTLKRTKTHRGQVSNFDHDACNLYFIRLCIFMEGNRKMSNML